MKKDKRQEFFENLWNETIEYIILTYQKWWKKEFKEKFLRLLFLTLKAKYEGKYEFENRFEFIKRPTKEELKFIKKRFKLLNNSNKK